ncbi:hypothetical protein CMUST_01115 [Corynebacterium mustelae]|uniref:Uncharacterized protein n=1 Tax=Corynebacterium mustelae TaxID=571915 RepID=A0A0G3GYC7_9CORY|nr:hypothetical protein [Corynebacterium mustelae]AKK04573.1 hypothetical protein CMUST_01115 [Corynebacterium mustelae]
MKTEQMAVVPEVVSDPVSTLARSNEKLVSMLAEQLGKPTAASGAAEVEKLRLAQDRIKELESVLASTQLQMREEGKELAACKRDLVSHRDAAAAHALENQLLKEQLAAEKKKVSDVEKKLEVALVQEAPDETAPSEYATKVSLVDRAWKKFSELWVDDSEGDIYLAFGQLERAIGNLLEGKK